MHVVLFVLALLTPVAVVAGEVTSMTEAQQPSIDREPAGDGCFAADPTKMIFRSEREPGNPGCQISLRRCGDGRLSPGINKTVSGSINPNSPQVLYASAENDPEVIATKEVERPDRASGKQPRRGCASDFAFCSGIYAMNTGATGLVRLASARVHDVGPVLATDGGDNTGQRFSADCALSWPPMFQSPGAASQRDPANFEGRMIDAEAPRAWLWETDSASVGWSTVFDRSTESISRPATRGKGRGGKTFLDTGHPATAPRRIDFDAQPAPDLPQTEAAITEPDLRAHVAALTAEAMAGRLTGTAGEIAATAYAAAALARAGLEPAGDDGSYFQEFRFTAGVSLGEGNALTLTLGEDRLTLASDSAWRPLAFSRVGVVEEAEIVFAGYGLVAPRGPEGTGQAAHDSYGDTDVTGKWVAVLRGLPSDISPQRRSYLRRFASLRYKASVAKAAGAAGIIALPAPGVEYRSPLPRLRYQAMSRRAGLPAIALGREMAERLIDFLGADRGAFLEAAEAGTPEAARRLDRATATAEIALDFERRTGRNVVARLVTGASPGAAPVIVGAHIDHLGRGETFGSLARGEDRGRIHPGADDNASGVAALLEIAETLAAAQAAGRLGARRDLIIGAWSGEELGLLGSSHFVEEMQAEAEAEDLTGLVSAYLNMDMVGRLEDRLQLTGLGSSPVWAGEIERRNAVVGLPLATSEDTYLPTDATEFYTAGVPILSAFTGTHDDYHRPSDTVDKLNFEGLTDVAELMALLTRGQLQADMPPHYVAVAPPRRAGNRRQGGVYLGTIPDYATEGIAGVPISGVVEGGPAEKAGLTGGDVITGLSGAAVADIYDLVRILNGLRPGQETEILFDRDGEARALSIVPAVRE
ncbi:MAG: M28 family peptidase [Pseudomonadota bacterium]